MQPVQVDLSWAQVSLLPSRPYSTRNVPDRTVVGLAFERQSGVHAIGSDRREDFDAWPGELAITQAGTEMFSESACGGEYLMVSLGASEETAVLLHHINVSRLIIAGNRRVFLAGLRLRRLILSRSTDNLAIEEELICLLGILQAATSHPSTRLTPKRCQRMTSVLEHIDAHLSNPLRLQALAQIAGLSRLQFLRGFTRAVGLTPHAFITERRLQHARKCLAESDASLASVAAECGFAQQSHLGSLLARQIGMTPGQYRKSIT